MSSIEHNRDWLGTFTDWGLTRKKHGELCDELSDHLSEMARRESHGAAQDAKETLSQPKVRRKLAGVHISDQVVATLNRLPNRKEWFELAALALWYVLIILSDLVSLKALSLAGILDCDFGGGLASLNVDSPTYTPWVTLAWLLQGVARGGFFACFFASLWRAWRLGSGVCLARILQLKLIHTLLVIGAFLAIGNRLWSSWYTPRIIQTDGPLWLSPPVLLAVMLVIGAVVFMVSRKKLWVPALGFALAVFFLYPAAPTVVETYVESMPIASEKVTQPSGDPYRQPSTDLDLIAKRAKRYLQWHDPKNIDEANNRLYMNNFRVLAAPGTYMATKTALTSGGDSAIQAQHYSPGYFTVEQTSKYLAAPTSIPGAALGWIAAPIPLLGLIGLFGLLFLMGRRSVFDAVMYSGLVFFAVASTIFPFVIANNAQQMFDFTPMGIVKSPCPGFEDLICNLNWNGDWLLIFGLVLSAAIPWLLTGLFLKPGQQKKQADDEDGMLEAG